MLFHLAAHDDFLRRQVCLLCVLLIITMMMIMMMIVIIIIIIITIIITIIIIIFPAHDKLGMCRTSACIKVHMHPWRPSRRSWKHPTRVVCTTIHGLGCDVCLLCLLTEQVCVGLEEAIQTMKLSEVAEVIVQPQYGFGSDPHQASQASVPPNSTLCYTVELVELYKVNFLPMIWLIRLQHCCALQLMQNHAYLCTSLCLTEQNSLTV